MDTWKHRGTSPTNCLTANLLKEKAKQYSATGRQNLGGATKTANQTTKKLEWYNILRMWKWRKIVKYRGKVGRTVAAPNTELYEA
jgi:hypothetical protein